MYPKAKTKTANTTSTISLIEIASTTFLVKPFMPILINHLKLKGLLMPS
jgi:hypothetical protein